MSLLLPKQNEEKMADSQRVRARCPLTFEEVSDLKSLPKVGVRVVDEPPGAMSGEAP